MTDEELLKVESLVGRQTTPEQELMWQLDFLKRQEWLNKLGTFAKGTLARIGQ